VEKVISTTGGLHDDRKGGRGQGCQAASTASRGTLGIELSAYTLSLCPILVLPLATAQLLSDSSSKSPIRQARKLVLKASYPGAVRVVVEPGSGVSLAYEANDGRIYCMETSFVDCPTKRPSKERLAICILKKALESRLLDDVGRMKPTADVLDAFKVGVVAVNGWLALGRLLTDDDAELAAKNHDLKVRCWACEKPS
jgi:hypothetical protein